jgi:hypothetical protein
VAAVRGGALLPGGGGARGRVRRRQFLASFSAFVGRDDRALELLDALRPQGMPGYDPHAPDVLAPLTPEDAVAAIVREAHGRQVVLLNEAHHVPLCRRFALRVARALRAEGFTYFAAETFAPGLPDPWAAGYPQLTLGNYSREPEFGNLVREALRLGYTGVAYEAEAAQYAAGLDREAAQLANLRARIFDRDPGARVFIYCGYSHAVENDPDLDWLAERINRELGHDPLTIDQSMQRPHSAPQFENAEYLAVVERLTQPSVFALPAGGYASFYERPGAVDLQVFHPRTPMVEGRPGWRFGDGFKPYRIPPGFVPGDRRVLVQAFAEAEPDDAVPVDQVLVEAGAEVPALALPPGWYRLVLQDEAGVSTTAGTIRQDV